MGTATDDDVEQASVEPAIVSGTTPIEPAREGEDRPSDNVHSGVQLRVDGERARARQAELEAASAAASAEQDCGHEAPATPNANNPGLKAAKRIGRAAKKAAGRVTRQVLEALNVSELKAAGVYPFLSLGQQVLQSYGQVQQARAEVMEPRSVAELVTFFKQVREQRRLHEGRMPYCTFRAGGQSFDEQALNNEVVLSLAHLNQDIVVDCDAQTVEVSAGAAWGDIVRKTLKHDMVPHVVVTTSLATAAGTLASDGICRHSPIYGSESGHVEWLDLLTPIDDEPRRLWRPGKRDESDDAQLFRAVIGGFGYLGVITRVCYKLLSLADVEGPTDAPVRVKTRLKCVSGFGEMVKTQQDWTAAQAKHRNDKTKPKDLLSLDDWEEVARASKAHKAVYSIAFLGPNHDLDGRAAVYESWYERSHEHKPYLVYNRRKWWRFLLELAASVSWIRRIGLKPFWWGIRKASRRCTEFVNEVEDYLFFMDVNRRAKDFMRERLKRDMPVIQQTFVLPPATAEPFLMEAAVEMKKIRAAKGIHPTLFDVLFMPRDRILMSASNGQEGFACSIAFEDVRKPDKREAVETLLLELSKLCRKHSGRVHFTKHVYAAPADLREMYQDQAAQFMLLKQRYDPDGLLHNHFFERVFLNACPPEDDA